MVLISTAFTALVWYACVAFYILWSSFRQQDIFATRGKSRDFLLMFYSPSLVFFSLLFLAVYYMTGRETLAGCSETTINRVYYICMFITLVLAILATTAAISMLRLFLFHLRLAYLDMTTVEYINHPSRNSLFNDEYEDEDEGYSDGLDDEFCLSDEEGNGWQAQSQSPSKTQYASRAWRVLRARLTRPWRALMRKGYYRYQRLQPTHQQQQQLPVRYQRRTQVACCCFSPESYGRQRRRRRYAPGGPDLARASSRLHMEDMLATRTIRPTVHLDDDEGEEAFSPIAAGTMADTTVGPNYEDDMGLDMSILDEKEDTALVPRKSSKAARLLDITDEEARQLESFFARKGGQQA